MKETMMLLLLWWWLWLRRGGSVGSGRSETVRIRSEHYDDVMYNTREKEKNKK
jgi:hypothetical protein